MEERDKDSRGQDLDKNLGERPRVNNSFSLLDGASAQIPVITPELTSLSKIAADKTRPLEERLESFEIAKRLVVGCDPTRVNLMNFALKIADNFFNFQNINTNLIFKPYVQYVQRGS